MTLSCCLWSSGKKNCRCISTAQIYRALALLNTYHSVILFCYNVCKSASWVVIRELHRQSVGLGGSPQCRAGPAFSSWSELVLPEWTPGLVGWCPRPWPLSILMSLFLKTAEHLSPTWKGMWKALGCTEIMVILGLQLENGQDVQVPWRAGNRSPAEVWAPRCAAQAMSDTKTRPVSVPLRKDASQEETKVSPGNEWGLCRMFESENLMEQGQETYLSSHVSVLVSVRRHACLSARVSVFMHMLSSCVPEFTCVCLPVCPCSRVSKVPTCTRVHRVMTRSHASLWSLPWLPVGGLFLPRYLICFHLFKIVIVQVNVLYFLFLWRLVVE